jgi:hypothetical protein
VTLAAPVPEQAPLQPAKVELALAVAASETAVPEANCAVQLPAEQERPPGVLATEPWPVPATTTVRFFCVSAKVAVQLCALDMVTLAAPLPEQAPDQPVKVDPDAAVGVRVTLAPWAKLAAHVAAEQLMPAGALATVPDPVPATVTESAWVVWVKVAVQDVAALMVRAAAALPLHAPLHPVKVEPAAGVAVSVTAAPTTKSAVQVPVLQLMPAGELATLPEPEPESVIDSARRGEKVTVQARSWVMRTSSVIATADGPVAAQLPTALVKTDPAPGV